MQTNINQRMYEVHALLRAEAWENYHPQLRASERKEKKARKNKRNRRRMMMMMRTKKKVEAEGAKKSK